MTQRGGDEPKSLMRRPLPLRVLPVALLLGYASLWGVIAWQRPGSTIPFAMASLHAGVAVLCLVPPVRWTLLIAAAACLLPLMFPVVQLVRRIAFVAEHGGMDSAETPGSPMAFLMGAICEWVCFGGPALALAGVILGYAWLPTLRRDAARRA